MNIINSGDSLFLLNVQQQLEYEKLNEYEFYFSMLRHDFLDTPSAIASMRDCWVYFYYKEVPDFNSELSLMYVLRRYILENVLKNPKFERLKKIAKGSITNALMCAAFTVNIFLDFLREIFESMPEIDVKFFSKFSNHSKMLFNEQFQQYQGYPKKLVIIEKTILKELRSQLEVNSERYEQAILKAIQFMDQYTLNEKELFDNKGYIH